MSLKPLPSLLIGLSWLAAQPLAANPPQGRLIELNSCEVYAGGCVVSSEATLSGRYRVQAWDISTGSWQGTDLSGLQAVVLETATDNLATGKAQAEQAVIYLPQSASAKQHQALIEWLKSESPQLASASIQTRTVPVTLTRSANGLQVAAGSYISFRTVSLEECQNQACGEDLWYEPSTSASLFTVALNAGSSVREPLLKLTWTERGKRSVFVARFGAATLAKNRFVRSGDWCSPTGNLF